MSALTLSEGSLFPNNNQPLSVDFDIHKPTLSIPNLRCYTLAQNDKASATEKKSGMAKVADVVKKQIKALETFWSYFTKTLGVVKRALQITANYLHENLAPLAKKIAMALSRMKLFAGVGLLFGFHSFYSNIKDLILNSRLGDKEGIAFGAMSLVMTAGGFSDDIITFTNGITDLADLPAIGWMQIIALPLGIWLSVYGAAVRSFSIASICGARKGLIPLSRQWSEAAASGGDGNGAVTPQMWMNLRSYLTQQLGITDAERKKIVERLQKRFPKESQEQRDARAKKAFARLKAVKDNTCLRRTAPIVHKQLKELNTHIDALSPQPGKVKKVAAALKNVAQLTTNKIIVNSLHLVASTVSLIALCLLFTPVAPVVSTIMLIVVAIAKLALHVYENGFIAHGLKEVGFAPATKGTKGT